MTNAITSLCLVVIGYMTSDPVVELIRHTFSALVGGYRRDDE